MNLKELKELYKTQEEILKNLKKEIESMNDPRLDEFIKEINIAIKAIKDETYEPKSDFKEGINVMSPDDELMHLMVKITGTDVKIIAKPAENKNEALNMLAEYANRDCVHAAHCCAKHGCKYGDKDCPVVIGKIKQNNPCEDCEEKGTE